MSSTRFLFELHALVANGLAGPGIEPAGSADPHIHSIIRLWHPLEAVTLDRPTVTAASPGVVAHLPLPTHLNTGVSIPVNEPIVLRGCKLVVVGIGAGNVPPLHGCAIQCERGMKVAKVVVIFPA